MSEPDPETLNRRLNAVERAVADGKHTRETDSPAGEPNEQVVTRLDALENRVDELDAALQAVRGFLGGVDAVNESIETRAEAAIAAVERLERRLEEGAADGHSNPEGQNEEPQSVVHELEPPSGTPDRSLDERLRDRW